MNGEARLSCHMETQTHAEKGADCIIHSKVLDPIGRFVILKAEIKDKIYVLINIYAPNKDIDTVDFLKTIYE